MATAKTIDKEVSVNDRPQRPAVMPADAPDSPVLPDVPDSPGVQKALAEEKSGNPGQRRVPPGGFPEGIPHGAPRSG